MRQGNEKIKRAVIELELDENFSLFKAWLTASYLDELIRASNAGGENRDYVAGRASAMGDVLSFVADMANTRQELRKSQEVLLKQRNAYT